MSELSIPAPARAHGVFDSATRAHHDRRAAQEAALASQKSRFVSQMYQSKLIREDNLGDWDHQGGRKYVCTVFEDLLIKLYPHLRFTTNPIMSAERAKEYGLGPGARTRAAQIIKPDGSLEYLSAYLWPVVQEFDVLIGRRIVVPRADPKIVEDRHGNAAIHVESDADRSKFDLSEPVFDGDGDLALTSDEVYCWDPWNRIPGWRTVLGKLVGAGYVTPNQVETFFTPADRASWAVRMGKRSEILPF